MELTWLCKSTNPGPTIIPDTSTVIASRSSIAGATVAMRPSRTSTSPVPSNPPPGSTTRAPRRTVSGMQPILGAQPGDLGRRDRAQRRTVREEAVQPFPDLEVVGAPASPRPRDHEVDAARLEKRLAEQRADARHFGANGGERGVVVVQLDRELFARQPVRVVGEDRQDLPVPAAEGYPPPAVVELAFGAAEPFEDETFDGGSGDEQAVVVGHWRGTACSSVVAARPPRRRAAPVPP